MKKDIHDNKILKYTVDFEDKEIIIKTINTKDEIIFIKFKDVLVHYFEMAMPNSIIYDIVECDGKEVINENKELLKNTKNFCWPIYYDTENQLIQKLEEYKYYIINSSLGLTGWVLAKSIE